MLSAFVQAVSEMGTLKLLKFSEGVGARCSDSAADRFSGSQLESKVASIVLVPPVPHMVGLLKATPYCGSID